MKKNEQQKQQGSAPANGVVTVNDDRNPSREERDKAIRNEPGTERLRSERESVEAGKQKGGSV